MKIKTKLTLFIVGMMVCITACDRQSQKGEVTPKVISTKAPFENVLREKEEEKTKRSEELSKNIEPFLDEEDPTVISLKKSILKFSAKTLSTFKMDSSDKNSIYAPFNYYVTLAAISEMTSPKAKKELLQALELKNVDLDQLQKLITYLEQYLIQGANGETKISTSFWLNYSLDYDKKIVTDRVKKLKGDYFPVNFMEKDTIERMSQWVGENTHNILGPQGVIDGHGLNKETQMVILNTLYFYDEWMNKFEPKDIVKDTFTKASGAKVTCDFMTRTENARVYIGSNYKATSLAFKDDGYILFVLPDDNGTTVQEVLNDKEEVEKLLGAQMQNQNELYHLELKVPKFSVSGKLSLRDVAERVGISSVFDDATSFDTITNEGMLVEQMDQVSRISIDENGCTAGSFSNVVASVASPKKYKKIKITLDRPFGVLLVKRDIPLLYGMVNNPIEKSKSN